MGSLGSKVDGKLTATCFPGVISQGFRFMIPIYSYGPFSWWILLTSIDVFDAKQTSLRWKIPQSCERDPCQTGGLGGWWIPQVTSLGLWDTSPSKWPKFKWLINGGDPKNWLTGMILQVVVWSCNMFVWGNPNPLTRDDPPRGKKEWTFLTSWNSQKPTTVEGESFHQHVGLIFLETWG